MRVTADVVQERGRSRRRAPVAQYDAAVVGAGPYGLSTAAHLLGRGLRVAVFGRPFELWRKHMPDGMFLRSHWWATNLSDPHQQYGFGRFLRESSSYDPCYPVPREAFLDYALWFRSHAVPDVDETYVASVQRQGGNFVLALEDGRTVQSGAVIVATGLYHFADRPQPYDRLPAGLVSHSCEQRDMRRFGGARVVVIGGGQSAIEYAALLHEAGAAVHVVARRPILWLAPDRANERRMLERILAPTASLAPGWRNWLLEYQPYLFCRLSPSSRDRWNRSSSVAAAAHWLRDRVVDKVVLHEGHTITRLEPVHGKVDAVLSDGQTVRADHLILATGFRADIDKLTMLHPSLRAEIRTEMATPVLTPWFESNVPGLYFVGLTSMRAFGPLYRFVAGCRPTAQRVASAVARQQSRVA